MVIGEKTSTKWLKYEVDGEIVDIKIRYVSKRKLEELQEKSESDQKFFESLLDYVIADWRGIESKKGQPAKCDLRTKIMLAEYLPTLCGRAGYLLGAAQRDDIFMPDMADIKKNFALSFPISGNGETIHNDSIAENA